MQNSKLKIQVYILNKPQNHKHNVNEKKQNKQKLIIVIGLNLYV